MKESDEIKRKRSQDVPLKMIRIKIMAHFLPRLGKNDAYSTCRITPSEALGNFCLCFCLSVMILYQYTYAWKLDKSKNQKEIFRLTKAKYERV